MLGLVGYAYPQQCLPCTDNLQCSCFPYAVTFPYRTLGEGVMVLGLVVVIVGVVMKAKKVAYPIPTSSTGASR
jgi:hypothetical protein